MLLINLYAMKLNIPRFGLFAVFFAGILVATLSAVLFGTIMFISQLNLFLAFAYLVRFLEGFSMAVLWSTVLAILLASHPTRPAAVYALIDTTYGLGQSLGPVFGSLMYTISGFLLPFCVCGAAIFSTGMLSLPLIGEAPVKKMPGLFGHCPNGGGGSRPLPKWFGALILRRIVHVQRGICLVWGV